MSYIRKIVGSDEKLIGIARLHWIYIVQGLVWFMACVAFAQLLDSIIYYALSMMPVTSEGAGVKLLALNSWLTPFALMFGAAICSIYVIKVLTTEIGMTSRRIIYKRGWMFIKTKEIEIEEIRGENLDLGYLGRVLGYGYLNLDCRFIGDISLPAIENPEQFLRALHKMRADAPDTIAVVVADKAEAMKHMPAAAVTAVPAAAAQAPSIPAPAATIDAATMAAIVEQVVPAMAESMAKKINEQVTEKVAAEIEAQGIIPVPADMEIPPDAATPSADPMADPSRLDPESPDEDLLHEFDDAAGVVNENESAKPKPTHAIH